MLLSQQPQQPQRNAWCEMKAKRKGILVQKKEEKPIFRFVTIKDIGKGLELFPLTDRPAEPIRP
jgi:hypothetical protein